MIYTTLKDDLYRYVGKRTFCAFLVQFITNHGFRYTCLFRLQATRWEGLLKIFIRCMRLKYGLEFGKNAKVGRGLYLVCLAR